MHKQSSCSESANKLTKDKWKMPGRWKVNTKSKLKRREEPNQMESIEKNCDRLARLQLSGLPSLFGTEKKESTVMTWGQDCVQVCCAGDRIWHPVSKLACDGEGTLRFQGYFVFLYSSRISLYSQLDLFYSYLLLYGKTLLFLQIELSYSTVFFLRKQKYAFFFSICSVNSLSRWNRQGPLQIRTSAWSHQSRWTWCPQMAPVPLLVCWSRVLSFHSPFSPVKEKARVSGWPRLYRDNRNLTELHKRLFHLPRSHQPRRECKDCCHKTSLHRWSPGSEWPCRSCPAPGRARPPSGSSCMSCSVWLLRSAAAGKSSGPRQWGCPLHPRRRAAKQEHSWRWASQPWHQEAGPV